MTVLGMLSFTSGSTEQRSADLVMQSMTYRISVADATAALSMGREPHDMQHNRV
ncbi:hypothetical protein [Stieleria varia]|uniref:Uncharacterized protein n=2 Tax=Stieleria varia TaxID=2528005 RepID=A0A5C6AZ89_9BACT|nr:hypothetical protein [Stieleria varia]TWU04741.1 hypothetical protein Pla52n_27840 [Stieleria varia]